MGMFPKEDADVRAQNDRAKEESRTFTVAMLHETVDSFRSEPAREFLAKQVAGAVEARFNGLGSAL